MAYHLANIMKIILIIIHKHSVICKTKRTIFWRYGCRQYCLFFNNCSFETFISFWFLFFCYAEHSMLYNYITTTANEYDVDCLLMVFVCALFEIFILSKLFVSILFTLFFYLFFPFPSSARIFYFFLSFFLYSLFILYIYCTKFTSHEETHTDLNVRKWFAYCFVEIESVRARLH